jgi:tetratricopeptide (TPR) repeat protein
MPAHIYMRMGDYSAAARQNTAAAAADRAYIHSSGIQGVYPLIYYSHNLHFLAIAQAMQGRFADAYQAAEQLVAHVGPYVHEMPILEGFLSLPTLVLMHFRRWDELLQSPAPAPDARIANALWHFARGRAYAATGKVDRAEAERKVFLEAANAIPAEAPFGLNSVSSIFTIAASVLDAHMALAKQDTPSAIVLLKKAAEAEDRLHYDEPPNWYPPVRETLGGVLMLQGEYAEAERVFRAELDKHPCSGRALFGLHASLTAQEKHYAAQWVQREFAVAWQHADRQLRLEDL